MWLQAAALCPSVQVQEYAEEGAQLVAFCGGLAEESGGATLQYLQPFSQVWNEFVASGEQAAYALSKPQWLLLFTIV